MGTAGEKGNTSLSSRQALLLGSAGPIASCSKHLEDVPHFSTDTGKLDYYVVASSFRMLTTKSNLLKMLSGSNQTPFSVYVCWTMGSLRAGSV